MHKSTTKLCKNAQTCAKNCVTIFFHLWAYYQLLLFNELLGKVFIRMMIHSKIYLSALVGRKCKAFPLKTQAGAYFQDKEVQRFPPVPFDDFFSLNSYIFNYAVPADHLASTASAWTSHKVLHIALIRRMCHRRHFSQIVYFFTLSMKKYYFPQKN